MNWLDHGHGDTADGLVPVDISAMTREARAPASPTFSRRRRLGTVTTWLVAVVAVAAAAWAVRDALFPVVADSTVSVWENPGRVTSTVAPVVETSPAATSTVPETSLPPSTEQGTSTSVDDSINDEGARAAVPTVTVDDHGGDTSGSGRRGGSDDSSGSGSSHGGSGSGSGHGSSSGHGSDG